MNIGQIKILAWLTAALLTLGLSFYVYRFMHDLPGLQTPPDRKFVQKVLEDVEPAKTKTEDLVHYDDVIRLFLPGCEACEKNLPNHRHLNWTGKEKVVKVDVKGGDAPEEPKAVPMRDLVAIAMIKVDLADPQNSSVFLKYKPRAAVQAPGLAGGELLRIGDALAAPHGRTKIAAIEPDAVVFSFEGGERENETLGPADFDVKTQIVQVGPDGVVMPALGSSIPRGTAAPFRPGKTTSIGENKYVLGSEDIKYVNEHYPEIFTRDVRTARHQDPKTGKYDGIEIKSVAANSLAASHGAQDGDVIKSINGHPVTSVQEAITYVKNNSGQYSTWEVVVESMGKLKTVVYHSPQE
jgi:hypothetical protein